MVQFQIYFCCPRVFCSSFYYYYYSFYFHKLRYACVVVLLYSIFFLVIYYFCYCYCLFQLFGYSIHYYHLLLFYFYMSINYYILVSSLTNLKLNLFYPMICTRWSFLFLFLSFPVSDNHSFICFPPENFLNTLVEPQQLQQISYIFQKILRSHIQK